MTVGQFAESVEFVRRQVRGSITSWGRTDAHAVKVGGFAGDPHTWGLGADMLYDGLSPPLSMVEDLATSVGLKVIREATKPHDHLQPLDFPAGPVTAYQGRTKTWS